MSKIPMPNLDSSYFKLSLCFLVQKLKTIGQHRQ